MSAPDEGDRIRPARRRFNAELEWDALDPDDYCRRNYEIIHENDAAFLARLRDFFSWKLAGRTGLHGVDVGAGGNLYPALSMLPFCDEITLIDYSRPNVRWLQERTTHYSEGTVDMAPWRQFWNVLIEDPAYAAVPDPWGALRKCARVRRQSVFGLARGRWDVGTMFFVAESISASTGEFRSAVSGFIDALKPGAPFVASFMEKSEGWRVGNRAFPAVSVCDSDVLDSLGQEAEVHELLRLGTGNPLRPGYTGMILVCGTKNPGHEGMGYED
ncbi:SCO2525 family SAM-dependent methyltransferase [Actinocorallia sp. A-T 12471]|uniref:SCO2525 family SAM-dependent methyltransferase n=1 Tax=Actinocorallia sp. A-T 12471 TaxID=3089813 RepID=UPI0029D12785|nr:SCO2525 family SAM-dependent methyltransferase [Actinocorallia sp. A-T 12471]MDX6739814.1 SCO2525 family SAM-dependent methyltransferase [Actinocorallia sp. A-T 12471]